MTKRWRGERERGRRRKNSSPSPSINLHLDFFTAVASSSSAVMDGIPKGRWREEDFPASLRRRRERRDELLTVSAVLDIERMNEHE